ncbi:MAG: hypothetical protein KAR13_03540 [Desulfobulbaceae bacterium]|nr:hypothetical protein [Desulfobulbaceae bacterium]
MKSLTTKTKSSTSSIKQTGTQRRFSVRPMNAATRTQVRDILRPHGLQPKLTIGRRGDRYEQEADAVADRVVAGLPIPEISPLVPGRLQTQPIEEEEKFVQPHLQRQPLEEKGEEKQINVADAFIDWLDIEHHGEGPEECRGTYIDLFNFLLDQQNDDFYFSKTKAKNFYLGWWSAHSYWLSIEKKKDSEAEIDVLSLHKNKDEGPAIANGENTAQDNYSRSMRECFCNKIPTWIWGGGGSFNNVDNARYDNARNVLDTCWNELRSGYDYIRKAAVKTRQTASLIPTGYEQHILLYNFVHKLTYDAYSIYSYFRPKYASLNID